MMYKQDHTNLPSISRTDILDVNILFKVRSLGREASANTSQIKVRRRGETIDIDF
jgi:hypothetical protein